MNTTPAPGADKGTDERTAFEAAARKGLDAAISGFDFQRNDDDEYKWFATRRLYEFWKEAGRAVLAAGAPVQNRPVDMILHCPSCGLQHIDAPDDRTIGWVNSPHRSHLCHGCGHIWRPADVPTNGVVSIATQGKVDSPPVQPAPAGEVVARPDLAKLKRHVCDLRESRGTPGMCHDELARGFVSPTFKFCLPKHLPPQPEKRNERN
jgi:hypothetical protein